MGQCDKCGAMLAAGATQCGYCGAVTQLAHDLSREAHAQQQHFAYQQQQVALQQQVARQHEAQASIKRTALHSLLWSALGLLCCLIPLFGIVGIVMALRARKMAQKYGLVIPATATIGLVLGAASVLASILTYTFVVVEEVERRERISQLEAELQATAGAEHLSPPAACQLAELRLLKDGIGEKSGSSLEGFECTGKLTEKGDSAQLDEFSFRWDSKSRHRVKVCFRHGARWTTVGFRVSASCDEPDDISLLFPAAGAVSPSASLGEKSQALAPASASGLPAPAATEADTE